MLKVDLQKAYDTIEWCFVENLLKSYRFPKHFIKVVMACVTTVSYTLLINGATGDPISPLLFVLCMEYLTRTFK